MTHLSVTECAINSIVPYTDNPRTHSAEQITRIAASIGKYGWTVPILVDSNKGVIAGHGRLLAALQLGLKTVPVIILNHLSQNQRKALLIADNRLAELASWDEDLLLKNSMLYGWTRSI